MRYRITIKGTSPIIMHNGAAGLAKRSAANLAKTQITKKKGSNRSAADDLLLEQLECQTSLWLDSKGAPTVPEGALRACIENGARKLKQGPQVREGLVIEATESFDYDKSLGSTFKELCENPEVRFTVPVNVQRQRIMRTRAKFDEWGVAFRVDVDDELIDKEQLATWLDIAGRRMGLGDWRPQKSGHYGRFETVSIEAI